MLHIERMRMQLPAGFEHRASTIARLVGESMAENWIRRNSSLKTPALHKTRFRNRQSVCSEYQINNQSTCRHATSGLEQSKYPRSKLSTSSPAEAAAGHWQCSTCEKSNHRSTQHHYKESRSKLRGIKPKGNKGLPLEHATPWIPENPI